MRIHEDRRIKYTKALLKEALIGLLTHTHISRISVTNLCEAADVNRSTFYAHYKDQYDLLRQLEEEVLSNIREYIQERSSTGQRRYPSKSLSAYWNTESATRN